MASVCSGEQRRSVASRVMRSFACLTRPVSSGLQMRFLAATAGTVNSRTLLLKHLLFCITYQVWFQHDIITCFWSRTVRRQSADVTITWFLPRFLLLRPFLN